MGKICIGLHFSGTLRSDIDSYVLGRRSTQPVAILAAIKKRFSIILRCK